MIATPQTFWDHGNFFHLLFGRMFISFFYSIHHQKPGSHLPLKQASRRRGKVKNGWSKIKEEDGLTAGRRERKNLFNTSSILVFNKVWWLQNKSTYSKYHTGIPNWNAIKEAKTIQTRCWIFERLIENLWRMFHHNENALVLRNLPLKEVHQIYPGHVQTWDPCLIRWRRSTCLCLQRWL